jgi:hypothetical protein
MIRAVSSAAPTSPVGSAGDEWWDEVMASRADVLIGELVDGLDEVATLAIPYGGLPRRAYNVYSAEFVCWSDIAGQSVTSLLSRPKVGEATVRALIAAAAGAVAAFRAAGTARRVGAVKAVRRLVAELDERERVILSARLWAPRPRSQRTLARRLGVHNVWVERNQPRAEARFADLVADPAHREVSECAAELGGRLGPFAPKDVVDAELRRLEVNPSSESARVLLHLAGPYVQRGEWFENTAVAGRHRAAATINAVFDSCPAPSTESLTQALTELGMPSHVAATYLASQETLRRFGDVWCGGEIRLPTKPKRCCTCAAHQQRPWTSSHRGIQIRHGVVAVVPAYPRGTSPATQ